MALQLPHKRIVEKFAPDDAVQAVYDTVRVSLADDKAGNAFELVQAIQGEKLSDLAMTVADAKLAGTMLRVALL